MNCQQSTTTSSHSIATAPWSNFLTFVESPNDNDTDSNCCCSPISNATTMSVVSPVGVLHMQKGYRIPKFQQWPFDNNVTIIKPKGYKIPPWPLLDTNPVENFEDDNNLVLDHHLPQDTSNVIANNQDPMSLKPQINTGMLTYYIYMQSI